MIKIRMLATAAGPAGTFIHGGEYIVSDEFAAAMTAGGFAELVDAPEAAALATPETATAPAPKPRARRKTKK